MLYVESDSKEATFYFAAEENFTRNVQKSVPLLILWQTEKTVMLGNNQTIEAEVDVEFAKKEGIKIVHRPSGGGAIYTDSGTVLYSIIQPFTKDANKHREETADMIIAALKTMGINAIQEGRNDILLDGKKISGLAQHTSPTHICTHGSLLYDTDLDILTKVLIPNESKLKPKGISSIRSRVTNIRPYIKNNFTIDEFIKELKTTLFIGKEYYVYNLNANCTEITERLEVNGFR